MQKKVKNVLIGTSILGLLGTATIVGNTISNKNEKIINNPKSINNKSNVKTTTSTLLNQEVVKSIGWDTKTEITLADWKTQAPNVTETFQSFMDNAVLTSIEIPSSIKALGDSTFSSNVSLNKVNFEPSSKLTTIGNNAFYGTTSLKIMEIPKSVAFINTLSFSESGIKNIIFDPNSVLNTIGTHAFGSNLLSIKIPESTKVIQKSAFSNSINLNEISMPSRLGTWGPIQMVHYGFSKVQWDSINWTYPPSNATILSMQVVRSIGWNNKTEITLADWKTHAPNVTEISASALANNIILTSIEIPDTVDKIGKLAFGGTTSLTNISMHTSLKTLDLNYGFTQAQWDAINWVSKLTGTSLNLNMVKKLGWDTKTEITLEDWKMLPDVIEISADAFTDNVVLTSIEIPSNIETIAATSFGGTTSLTNISMNIKLKTPDLNYGFTQEQWDAIIWTETPKDLILTLSIVKKLGWDTKTEITLEDWKMLPDVIEISADAFTDNVVLTSIEIPSNIETIAATSFGGTTSLTNISMNIKLKTPDLNYGFTQAQWDTIIWTYSPIDAKILNASDLELIGWKGKTKITLEDWKMAPNVIEIGSAFENNTTLTSIEIPTSIEIIGNSSFSGASALSFVVFESNSQLQSIGESAFKTTTALKAIRLGLNTKLTTIGDLAFADSGITIMDLPSSIENIGNESFLNSKLTNISMDYFVAKESLIGLYGLSQEQWNNIIWKNIPTTGLINSFIATQLLKTNLKIDWEEISTYNGIAANAFSDTNIVSITIDSGFDIDSEAFANTPSLTNITLNPIYKKDGLSYGLSEEQLNSVDWFSSSDNNSYYNRVITIIGITASLIVVLSLATVVYISLKRR